MTHAVQGARGAVCPKCQYVRQPGDHAPHWQCPKCGIAYAKFDARAGKGRRPMLAATPRGRRGFRAVRIMILLLILAGVAINAWLGRVRATDWTDTLRVVVYPINADGSAVAEEYIRSLTSDSFAGMEEFMKREAGRYGLASREPVDVKLAPPIAEHPPAPPRGGVLASMWWSLSMRYWALRVDTYQGPSPEVRAFLLFHDPQLSPQLAHSVGIREGFIGLVNAFASRQMAGSNSVVIVHEVLHTLGATDKYDPGTNLPIYPQGYANPAAQPRLPQHSAEIMAGRIPVTERRAEMPRGLDETVIGETTAREIGWVH